MSKLYVWPDDRWCTKEEYDDVIDEASDDYRVVEVSDDWNYDQIEEFVYKLNRGEL